MSGLLTLAQLEITRMILILMKLWSVLVAVILEAPVGESSVVWSLVQPIIAKRTKVLIFILLRSIVSYVVNATIHVHV